ncbi:MAG TPA: hypothetical protein VFR89_01320, partial [candidate division Zixibacteria bacterium]|nr:hypothetical protein [candidate division Zixibacteria bacterium]
MAYSPAERIKKLSQLERFLSREGMPVLLPAAIGLLEVYSACVVRFERLSGKQLETQWLVRGEKNLKKGNLPLSNSVS